jgi:hypothetical protein
MTRTSGHGHLQHFMTTMWEDQWTAVAFTKVPLVDGGNRRNDILSVVFGVLPVIDELIKLTVILGNEVFTG